LPIMSFLRRLHPFPPCLQLIRQGFSLFLQPSLLPPMPIPSPLQHQRRHNYVPPPPPVPLLPPPSLSPPLGEGGRGAPRQAPPPLIPPSRGAGGGG
ncbi:hypothetical protein PMAYCL1PPCAC_12608, partial [Pristionchus mayeri]